MESTGTSKETITASLVGEGWDNGLSEAEKALESGFNLSFHGVCTAQCLNKEQWVEFITLWGSMRIMPSNHQDGEREAKPFLYK